MLEQVVFRTGFPVDQNVLLKRTFEKNWREKVKFFPARRQVEFPFDASIKNFEQESLEKLSP